jgi:hypothetical protein
VTRPLFGVSVAQAAREAALAAVPRMPVIARLTGRCADGAQRDGGRRLHVVLRPHGALSVPCFDTALCGAKPGRLSNGWTESDGAEVPTCPRCRRIAEKGGAA